jgi:hypothetical protein
MMQVRGELVSDVYVVPPASTVPEEAEGVEEIQSEDALASAGGILSGLALAIVLWVILLVPVLLLLFR